MDYIIAVEGFGGYPFWQKRIPKDIQTKKDLLFGLGPSQVFNFVVPLFSSRSNCLWWYYPQFMVWPVIGKIRKLRKIKQPGDRIILIGFSYGGSTVHAAAHWFRETIIDLVITLDPVGKWRWNVTPDDPEAYRFRKAASVVRWVNLYQRIDRCSFGLPGLPWLSKPIWGGKVQGADRETELGTGHFQFEDIYYNETTMLGFPGVKNFSGQAHWWFPAHNEAIITILMELEQI